MNKFLDKNQVDLSKIESLEESIASINALSTTGGRVEGDLTINGSITIKNQIDSSSFPFFSSGSGFLGIGTSSPSGELHLSNTTDDPLLYLKTRDGDVGIRLTKTTGEQTAEIGFFESADTDNHSPANFLIKNGENIVFDSQMLVDESMIKFYEKIVFSGGNAIESKVFPAISGYTPILIDSLEVNKCNGANYFITANTSTVSSFAEYNVSWNLAATGIESKIVNSGYWWGNNISLLSGIGLTSQFSGTNASLSGYVNVFVTGLNAAAKISYTKTLPNTSDRTFLYIPSETPSTTSYVDFGTGMNSIYSNFSTSIFVKGVNSGVNQNIMGNAPNPYASVSGTGWKIYVSSDNRIGVEYADGTTGKYIETSPIYKNNQTYNIFFDYCTGLNPSLFVNYEDAGVIKSTGVTGDILFGTLNNTGMTTLGMAQAPSALFKGFADNLSIFTGRLTTGIIVEMMRDRKPNLNMSGIAYIFEINDGGSVIYNNLSTQSGILYNCKWI